MRTEILPSCERPPRPDLLPITVAGTRYLLEAIRDSERTQNRDERDRLDLEAATASGSINGGVRVSVQGHHQTELCQLGQLLREQAALRRVATMVAANTPADEVFATVAQEVGQVVDADSAAVWRYEEGGARVLAKWDGLVGAAPARPRCSGEGDGAMAARCADVRSSVTRPIVVGGDVWGSVEAAAGSHRLPPDAESRMGQFAKLAATAIANLQASAEVRRLAEEQAALRRVATMVAAERPAAELFAQIAEELGGLLAVQAVGIQRFGPGDEAVFVGQWGMMAQHFPVGSTVKLDGPSASALVYRSERNARFGGYEQEGGEIALGARAAGLRCAVGTPIFVNGRLWGAIVAGASDREEMPADAEARIRQFTQLVATAISNLEAREEIQRLSDEQAALRRVATMVAQECGADSMFAQIAEEVGRSLRVETVSIDRYDPEGGCTVLASWGALGDVLEVGSRGRAAGESASPELGPRSSVAAPIRADGRLFGAIVVGTSRSEGIPPDAELRIAQFAELAATAISNLQARTDLAESRARIMVAADEERRRVTRDLHDGAQQQLVHTIVTLKLARDALDRGEEDAAPLLSEAAEHAKSANSELRELAHGILPSALTLRGLDAGVKALAGRMPILVDVVLSVDRLSPAVEATAYVTIAEALSNVVKHAEAGRATVSVHAANGALEVEVRDDGVGGALVDGPGLLKLRDRLSALGGHLRVESSCNGGTRVAATIPGE